MSSNEAQIRAAVTKLNRTAPGIRHGVDAIARARSFGDLRSARDALIAEAPGLEADIDGLYVLCTAALAGGAGETKPVGVLETRQDRDEHASAPPDDAVGKDVDHGDEPKAGDTPVHKTRRRASAHKTADDAE